MCAFHDLTESSGLKTWRIGRARLDLEALHLSAPSPTPFLAAEHLGDDFAFVADPFRVVVRGVTYVLAEAWSRSAGRGQIAAFEVGPLGQVVNSAIVLAEPFHLSYPCVFELEGDFYLLPEAWESGKLMLYKAQAFPWAWERCKVLFELGYADPQVFLHDGVWYLFLNTDPLTNATASLYWAESPLGRWRAHPQSPIYAGDALRARSAGPLLRHCGRILRFSQDCRQRYGQAVFASEIVELSPTCIRTEPLGLVGLDVPPWAATAFHHLDVFNEGGVCCALFDGY